jgi:ABC-type transport system involved in multi-copper enzyme maturation permease subunit
MTVIAANQVGHAGGPVGARLINSELLKIRTTNTWWIFGIGAIVTTVLSLLLSIAQAHFYLKGEVPTGGGDTNAQDFAATFALQHDVATQAARVFTSGQFFGGLAAMVLAILVVTNEYQHQTATTTFLTTPHRTTVVLSKLATAMIAAAFFWVVVTVLDLIGGSIYFPLDGFSSHLGDWSVIRAILINLVVFALWGVFGVGIGVLIRSQIGATITAIVLYVVGSQVAEILAQLIYLLWYKHDWVMTAQVIVPARAAEIAVAPTKLYPQSPPEWVGAAVLVGYGLVLGSIGTLIMRKRDIS